ncbi:transposase [Acetobacter aceti NRIC 0242]|uniref:Transposase n=1 Tax=Acetobacter aceti NBRC 14818 TaxID=887700 RepID=A0AB33I9V7_ACEAC|nr:hypothetical protein EMQ_0200 [Acetobacter aceti NBRC 14818]GBO79874.1 transposase [Acetobacter aceti NRIC 0242]
MRTSTARVPIKKGRELTTTINVIVDATGKAVALSLTSGRRAGINEAEPLLDEVDPKTIIAG